MADRAPRALFNGSNLDDWLARSQDGQHEWAAVAGVSLNPQDSTRFVAEPGQGVFYNGPTGRTADLYTAGQHGDCELHVEFVVPKGSNSGVYLMGKYEIQVLDSWGETDLKYGTCGGIYARWIDGQSVGGNPPRVNASRPPGAWQSFDVIFRAPRFDTAGNKRTNARFVKVIWNGQVVHENVEVDGPTRASMPGEETPLGPLMLQGDHGPVAYRNLQLRDLG